jgi:hypothetical protein
MALWKPTHSYKMPASRMSHLIKHAGLAQGHLPVQIVQLVADKAGEKKQGS